MLVVGGGNSAGQAAMFLSQHAASCRLLIRGGDLGKSMSRYLVDEIERREQIEVLTHTEVVELRGEPLLEAVVVRDTRTGERRELPAQALFVFIGASPHTDWLDGHVAMDEHGFLLTGRDLQGEDLAAYDGERAAVPRDQPAGRVRRRRRPLRIDQARRLSGRRGLDGDRARAPPPRRLRRPGAGRADRSPGARGPRPDLPHPRAEHLVPPAVDEADPRRERHVALRPAAVGEQHDPRTGRW